MKPVVAAKDLPLLVGPTGVAPGRHLLEGHTVGLEHLTLVLGESGPGSSVPIHSHEYEEIFIVHGGRGTYTVGDTTIEAGPGDVVIIPSNVPHGFANQTQEPLCHTAVHGAGRFVYQMPD